MPSVMRRFLCPLPPQGGEEEERGANRDEAACHIEDVEGFDLDVICNKSIESPIDNIGNSPPNHEAKSYLREWQHRLPHCDEEYEHECDAYEQFLQRRWQLNAVGDARIMREDQPRVGPHNRYALRHHFSEHRADE